MEKAKPMRQAMPQVAAWIDELRTVFGAECINSAIKAGIDGQPTFYASEGGLEIGTRAPYSVDRAVNGGDMSLDRKNAAADQEMISRRHK